MIKLVFGVLSAVLLAAALAIGALWLINARSEKAANGCVMHLREIAALKEQWGLDHHKTTNDVPTWNDLRPYMRPANADWIPHCPAGGVYTIGGLGEPPRCSIGGRDHTLPQYGANGTSRR